jgi:predicted molibdopterin-dependent oxidoreductase YjgC
MHPEHVSDISVNIPAIREVEALWKAKLDKEGLTAPDMLAAAERAHSRPLHHGREPVMSDQHGPHDQGAQSPIPGGQDILMTETAALAHVVLPASSFAEKVGTFTNTERRVQRVRRAVNSPGDAMKDSLIIMELSKRMGYEMPYPHTVEIFREIGQAWPAMAGMSYARLEDGGLQWPCPTPDHPGTQFLFKGGFPRGKGRLTLVKYKQSIELTDKDYPFILTTGRQLFQYHTGGMTRRVKPINTVSPESYVEINPDDARSLSIEGGSKVKVRARAGPLL